MKKCVAFWVCLGAMLLLAAPAPAQDNLDGGWASAFGGLYGTARAPFPVIFPSGGEVEVAWMLDPNDPDHPFSLPPNASQILFDSAGNLYWHSQGFWSDDYVASCTPDGHMRWTGPPEGLGYLQTDNTPVVGQDAVYMLGMFDPNEWDPNNDWPHCELTAQQVFALDKADGHELWKVKLNNESYCPEAVCNNSQPNPILYNGRLFVMGVPDPSHGVAVYQIDAATGTILGNNRVAQINNKMCGNMCLVPDKFGAGIHGLYVLMFDDFYATVPQLFGLAVNTITHTTSWVWESSDTVNGSEIGLLDWGTWAHVMYNATYDRIYVYTEDNSWGADLFSFDPLVGEDPVLWADSGGWWLTSGCYQTGALDFDDTRIITGAWDGGFSMYADDGLGNVSFTDSIHHLVWDQPRQFVQLLYDEATDSTVAVSASSGWGTGMTHIFMADLDDRRPPAEDGPLYIDDVEVYQGPDVDHLTLVYSEDFEAYAEGELPPASGWESLYGYEQPAPVVATDPTGAGHGKVLVLDPVAPPDPNDPDNWWGHGVHHAFTPTTQNVIVTRYKQWMQDTSEIYEVMWGQDPNDYSRGFAYGSEWDSRRCTLEWLEEWSQPNYQIDQEWEDVMYAYDLGTGTASVKVADRDQVDTVWDPGEYYAPTDSAAGIGFTMWHGDVSDNWPRLRVNYLHDVRDAWQGVNAHGGPLVGPDGKIYYFEAFGGGNPLNEHPGWLFALQPKPECIGDLDGDGDTDLGDLATLLGAYGSTPGGPGWNPVADLDGDDDVDLSDLATLLGDYGCGG